MTSNWNYLCYTDEIGLKCTGWEMIYVPKEQDIRRQTRKYKTLAHIYAPANQSIYIDATRTIIGDLDYFAGSKRKGLWLEPHPSGRKCIFEEARVTVDRNLDDKGVIGEQLKKYHLEGYPEQAGLYRGGVIVRNQGCEEFNQIWWNEIQNGSHRDQISLPYAVKKSGVELHKILPGIVDAYFRLALHEPRVLKGGLIYTDDRKEIADVPTDKYIVWGNFPDAEFAIASNPPQHLITNQFGGMIFPRWLWNYLQLIDHLLEYINIYKGQHLLWQSKF